MPDTRLFRAIALTFAFAVPASLCAQPQSPVPQANVPQTAATPALSDEDARVAANQQQANTARLQLEANVANQQAVAAADKARAENAQAHLAYEAEKARLASDYEVRLTQWKADVAACKASRKKVCVQR